MSMIPIAEIQDAQAYADIKERIQLLNALAEEDLSGAMIELKEALKLNPNACALMLPEDIGGIVSALQRITGKYLVDKSKSPAKRSKAASKLPSIADISKMSAADQAELLGDL